MSKKKDRAEADNSNNNAKVFADAGSAVMSSALPQSFSDGGNEKTVGQMNADETTVGQARQDAALLNAVYQSVSMGAGAYEHMLKVAGDDTLKDELTKGMKNYRAIEAAALGRLHRLHESPEEVGTMTRLMSRAGIRLNSSIDSGSSNLARLAQNNSTMGITELRTAMKKNPGASDEALRIAEAYMNLEQTNLRSMGNFSM